jgi:hypothetical protein
MLHVAVVAMLLVFQDQHAAVVHGDTGTIEVTLHNDSASVRLSTPGRAFQLDLDSLTLAAWADTAAAQRGPRRGAKETEFPAARLATSLVSMAIIRLSTDEAAPYAFMAAGYGGLSARITLPHDSAMRLFNVMRAPPIAENEDRVFTADEVNQRAHLMGVIPSAYSRIGDIRQGLNGMYTARIIFEFVVDTSGHVEQKTFHTVLATDQKVAAAIEQSLRESPYRPAERNGHKVRQLVRDTLVAVQQH